MFVGVIVAKATPSNDAVGKFLSKLKVRALARTALANLPCDNEYKIFVTRICS